jgi:hypothetical protein
VKKSPQVAEIPPSEGLLADLNERFEDSHPQEILLWAFDNIPRIAVGTSFQLGGLVNIFFSREIVDRVPVLFLETGFTFPRRSPSATSWSASGGSRSSRRSRHSVRSAKHARSAPSCTGPIPISAAS